MWLRWALAWFQVSRRGNVRKLLYVFKERHLYVIIISKSISAIVCMSIFLESVSWYDVIDKKKFLSFPQKSTPKNAL